MTTLKVLKKNIYLIISIMVLVSFIGIPFVYSEDNHNRYRDDSSSIFSPGYLNAAKYQAETIKYQTNMPNNGKKESLLDKAIDYAKDKLGYTTNQEEQAQKNAAPPVLQQKRSSPKASAVSKTALVSNTVSPALATFTMPNNIMNVDTAQSTLNMALGEYYITGAQALSNGNMVIWQRVNNNDNSQVIIKITVKDAQGNTISEITPKIMDDSYQQVMGVTDIGNGEFVVSMYGMKGYEYTDYLQAVYTSQGELKNSIVYDNHDPFEENMATYGNPGYYTTPYSGLGQTVYLGNDTIATTVFFSNYTAQLVISDNYLNPKKSIDISYWGSSIASLGNGYFVVSSGSDGNMRSYNLTAFDDSNLNIVGTFDIDPAFDTGTGYSTHSFGEIESLGNGKFAMGWVNVDYNYDFSTNKCAMEVDVFGVDATTKTMHEEQSLSFDLNNTARDYGYQNYKILGLGNGDAVIAIANISTDDNSYTTAIKLLANDGTIKDLQLSPVNGYAPEIINGMVSLGEGNFGIMYRDLYGDYAAQQFVSSGSYRTAATDAAMSDSRPYTLVENPNINTYSEPLNNYRINEQQNSILAAAFSDNTTADLSISAGKSSLKTELLSALLNVPGKEGMDSSGFRLSLTNKELTQSALSASPGKITQADMNMATNLSGILNNPTADQKVVLDVVKNLLADIDKVAKEQGKENANNPELNKVQDDILNIVAKVLLAQAIPDLLKKGDIENIKGIFANLDSAKTRVILEYKESTTPYYDELKKLLERNTSALDLNLKNKLEKELRDMSRSEIDRIVEKLKQKENRTFEEDYIIQQEQKVRAKYLDPNKKKLEATMTVMLQDFTKKLATTLESAKR